MSIALKDNNIAISGRVDTSNAADVEKELFEVCAKLSVDNITIDAAELTYISSAGLRVLMKLRKEKKSLSLINVSSDVYEILETTGFTQILDVHKAMRSISIEGCQLIGHGGFGTVYRLNEDTIVKVYDRGATAGLDFIRREQETAKKAFVHGIPTAISFDVVRVGEFYGVVYELLDADDLAQYIIKNPDQLEEMARRFARLAKHIHSIQAKEGDFQEAASIFWAPLAAMKGLVSDEQYKQVEDSIAALPTAKTLVHGDFHARNTLIRDNELELIDMGDVSVGHPILEFTSLFLLISMFEGPGAIGPRAQIYTGMDCDTLHAFTDIVLDEYFGEKLNENNRPLFDEAMELLIHLRRVPIACARLANLGDAATDETNARLKEGIDCILQVTPERVKKVFDQLLKTLF